VFFCVWITIVVLIPVRHLTVGPIIVSFLFVCAGLALGYRMRGARVGNLVVQVLLRDRTTYSLTVTTSPALFGGKRTTRCLEQLEDWRTQY
jgi:hypothetical protein